MHTPSALHGLLHASLFALILTPAAAQNDAFDDGNDSGWTHYAPLASFGSATAYVVGGGTYNISCAPSPDVGQLGPTRAGSLRQDQSYSTFCVSVDITGWDPSEDTSMGILARVQANPGLGSTNCYAFTYQGNDDDVEINLVTGEVPTNLSGTQGVILQPGNRYRMVFFGVGDYLEGRIYDVNDLSAPLVTSFANDSTYTQGTSGLVVFSDENTRVAASFDNFSASSGTIAPPDVSVAAGMVSVSWDSERGVCHSLEASSDLGAWSPVFGFTQVGGRIVFSEPLEPRSRYYRLRMGPALLVGLAGP